MRSRRYGLGGGRSDEEPPLRSELFSADQMERHGKRLAAAHRLDPRRATDRLLARLAENEGVLIGACDLLTAAVKANRRITPAGEWLLDNFYLIEEQIRTAERHLPRGYSRELPRLAERPVARTSTRLRHRARGDLARRRPRRCGEPQPLRCRLPDDHRLEAGRAVGHPDHAAPGADRESAARGGRIDCRRIAPWPADSWADQMMEVAENGSEEPDPGDRRHGAVRLRRW